MHPIHRIVKVATTYNRLGLLYSGDMFLHLGRCCSKPYASLPLAHFAFHWGHFSLIQMTSLYVLDNPETNKNTCKIIFVVDKDLKMYIIYYV